MKFGDTMTSVWFYAFDL